MKIKKEDYTNLAIIMCIAVNKHHFNDSYVDSCLNGYVRRSNSRIQSPGFFKLSNEIFPELIRSVTTSDLFESEDKEPITIYDLAFAGRWLLHTKLTIELYSLFNTISNSTSHWAHHYKLHEFIEENTETMEIESRMRQEYIETNSPEAILSVIYPGQKRYTY